VFGVSVLGLDGDSSGEAADALVLFLPGLRFIIHLGPGAYGANRDGSTQNSTVIHRRS
jgi:hypothetical protein